MINTEDKRTWGIHTMDDSLFLNKNVIGIGWKAFGDCSKLEPTREAFKQHYVSVYADSPTQNEHSKHPLNQL